MKTAKTNWITTLMGILALLGTAGQIYSNPTKVLTDTATQAQVIAGITAGVGLIAAKDGNKGTDAQPPAPAGN